MVRQQAEGIGIALEVGDVAPLCLSEAVLSMRTIVRLQELPFALAEIRSYRPLAAMPKGRIAKVVGQACRTDYAAQFRKMRVGKVRMPFKQQPAHVIAQAASYTAYLKAVCQPVMDEDATWQREDLRLVLQAAERSREDEPVVVSLELRPVILPVLYAFLPETLVGKQPPPIQLVSFHLFRACRICGLHRSLSSPVRGARQQRYLYASSSSPGISRPWQSECQSPPRPQSHR